MRFEIPTTPALRAFCLAGFLGMTAQLLVLTEPSFAVQIVDATWDKAVHFLYFGTMAFLLWVANARRWALAAWLTVAFIGAADETLQAYTPGRTSDLDDWIADAIGAAAALLIARRVTNRGGARAAPSASKTADE